MTGRKTPRMEQQWLGLRRMAVVMSAGFLAIFLISWTAYAHAGPVTAMVDTDDYFADTGQSLGNLPSWGVALGDLDGDDDLDAIVANGAGSEPDDPDRIWINDGDARFTPSSGLGSATSYAVALGDLDGDMDLDVYIGTSGYNEGDMIWLNDSTGTFTDTGQLLNPESNSVAVALGDVDGDGDLDAVVVDNWAGGNHLLLNNGKAKFSDSGQLLGSGESSYDVALADLDSDNDLDIFIANATYPGLGRNQVWFNNGSGVFTRTLQALGNSDSHGVDLADLDNDGDHDAFVVNRNQANRVWLNDGSGIFSDSLQELGSRRSSKVNLADVDHDRDVDAVVANVYDGSRIWLNDGSGTFVESQLLSSFGNQGLAVADLNQDAVSDLYFANTSFCDFVCVGLPNEIWLGTRELPAATIFYPVVAN